MARENLITRLSESISSTWLLLTDTTNFLSRMKLLEMYEQELRTWRSQLSHGKRNQVVVHEVRDAIIALRRSLRRQGYDLRLGSKDIAIEGWRNDEAMGEGFSRLVLGLAEDDIYAIAGEANHNELASALEERCRSRKSCKPYQLHCLWYRWRNNVLVLSGAASETSEQFEELKKYFETNKEFLLRRLSSL